MREVLHTHSETPMTAENFLQEILLDDASKLLLEESEKTISHNGISYLMVRKDLAIKAMNDFARSVSEPKKEEEIELIKNDYQELKQKKEEEIKHMQKSLLKQLCENEKHISELVSQLKQELLGRVGDAKMIGQLTGELALKDSRIYELGIEIDRKFKEWDNQRMYIEEIHKKHENEIINFYDWGMSSQEAADYDTKNRMRFQPRMEGNPELKKRTYELLQIFRDGYGK